MKTNATIFFATDNTIAHDSGTFSASSVTCNVLQGGSIYSIPTPTFTAGSHTQGSEYISSFSLHD